MYAGRLELGLRVRRWACQRYGAVAYREQLQLVVVETGMVGVCGVY